MPSIKLNFTADTAKLFDGKIHMRMEVRNGQVVMRPTRREKVRACSESIMGTISYRMEGETVKGASVHIGAGKLDKLIGYGAVGLEPGKVYDLEALKYTWFAMKSPNEGEAPKYKASVSKG